MNKNPTATEYVDRLEARFGTIENPHDTNTKDIVELLREGNEPLTVSQINSQSIEVPVADYKTAMFSEGFEMTDELMDHRLEEACKEIYPDYPQAEDRLRISSEKIPEIKVLANQKDRVSIKRFLNGTNDSYRHPNRTRALEKFKLPRYSADDDYTGFQKRTFAKSLTTNNGEYSVTIEGIPLHPNFEAMLGHGAVVGPGFYWELGPNKAADAIVPCLVKDQDNIIKVYILTVVRSDVNQDALFGGMFDKDEKQRLEATDDIHKQNEIGQEVALRETAEEAGGEIIAEGSLVVKTIYRGVVADLRATLNAWPETIANLVFSDSTNPLEHIANKRLSGSQEGRAGAMLASLSNISELFANHEDITLLALKQYEKMLSKSLSYEIFIDKEGNLKRKSADAGLLTAA